MATIAAELVICLVSFVVIIMSYMLASNRYHKSFSQLTGPLS